MPQTPVSIIVDWGTTSLRASLVSDAGETLAHLETQGGIQFIKDGRFEEALMAAIEPWFAEHGLLPVFAIGMITSRNGWLEVPYVDTPANATDLAAGSRQLNLANGAPVTFLAGLRNPKGDPFPDVMRGEETQIVGHGLEKDQTLVLPGTHSKWARVQAGRIVRFQTYVTGEIFALLTQHSFIARAAVPQANAAIDWQAFDRGAALAAGNSRAADSFFAIIFSARTGLLDGKLKPSETLDYVSGLVIGSEFRQARSCGWFQPGDTIGIIGNDGLNDRYKRVAPMFELRVEEGHNDEAKQGVLLIAAEKAPAGV
ncbi:2-dehydro-3-deoxygalactonokinase [Limoniibacter endophyticus]|uniref:2-dehydro-3-deoxygalactonokinase n=1 Tax=Limoniibacter endophyticus TaxID=1565040 RepID=A0A8J3DRD9_9HYPH|nr:2-dehydro-3-deoxygalactonokinase [Limoniibacter endophyticus]GHC76529.1 2-dehydro-3-deoxygalactonokinase [Limoniibacter endophyticus]